MRALLGDVGALALRVVSQANVGVYATGVAIAILLMTGPWVQTSVYDINTIDFHFKGVLTNIAPIGTYRKAMGQKHRHDAGAPSGRQFWHYLDKVCIVLGDTDRGDGFSSASSRSIFTNSSAMCIGSERIIDAAEQLMADELEVVASDLSYVDTMFITMGINISIDLFALAEQQTNRRIPDDCAWPTRRWCNTEPWTGIMRMPAIRPRKRPTDYR